jgi:hypothetical protein
MKAGIPSMLIAALVLSASPALAGHARPGLWTSTVTIDLGGQDPQMSADQAARMNSMGIKMPGKAQPIVSKMCLTPADAAADTPPKRTGCTYQNIHWNGMSATGEYVCKGLMNGSGKFSVTYQSDKHYEGTTTFVGAPIQGKSAHAFTRFTGEWLSDDCGTVKPSP